MQGIRCASVHLLQMGKAMRARGTNRFVQKKPVAYHHPRKTSQSVIGKILELRTEYQLLIFEN